MALPSSSPLSIQSNDNKMRVNSPSHNVTSQRCRQCLGLSESGAKLRLAIIVLFAAQLLYNISSEKLAISSSLDYKETASGAYASLRLHQEPPKYLIDRARKRAKEYQAMLFESKGLDETLAVQHPAFFNISASLEPREEWTKKYQPDISIIGVPKAGTSQLYNILTSHPDLTRFHPTTKEYCFEFGRGVNADMPVAQLQKILYNVVKDIDLPSPDPSKRTVNACLDLHKAMFMRQYLESGSNHTGATSSKKMILILRDPADWLWSGYNFWHQPKHHDAVKAVNFGWAKAPNQYRSPELFHEMLLAGERFYPTVELLTYFRDKLNGQRIRVAAEIEKAAPGTILIVKSEDMSPDIVQSSGFLDTLSDFLGVSQGGFNQSTYSSFSNCGNGRGVGHLCKKSNSAYAVAGGRAMLEESRDLVYLHFAEECKFWKDKFGVVYEGCLAVREKYGLDT
ncbi:MAG: hypothetical protein SGILL_005259 [Bacillariaceae sp.]